MKLHEQFKEYETMWEGPSTKSLTEASRARQAYEALMEIQASFNDLPGWLHPDPVQDDEYSMAIKYDLAPDTYVWLEYEDGQCGYVPEVEDIEDRCNELGVSLSIVENDNTYRQYDIIVYLRYEG